MCLQFVQKQCLQTKHCCWHCCFIGYWLFVCTEIILKINSRQNSACLSSADKTMTCIFAILNPTQQNFSWNTAELVVNTTNQNLPLTSPAEFVFNQHSRICRPCWQYRSIGSGSSVKKKITISCETLSFCSGKWNCTSCGIILVVTYIKNLGGLADMAALLCNHINQYIFKILEQQQFYTDKSNWFYICCTSVCSCHKRHSFVHLKNIWIHFLEYPIPPPLSSVRHIFSCAMDLGNRESYHRSAGVKTTRKKIIIIKKKQQKI